MNSFVPKWEKSFVVVNKEQRTGMVCYCFSVIDEETSQNEITEERKADSNLAEINKTLAVGEDKSLSEILTEFQPYDKLKEETTFDYFLWIYQGTFGSTDVSLRLLHRNYSLHPKCENCAKKHTRLDQKELSQIVQSLSHPFLMNIVATRCESNIFLIAVPVYKRSLKDIIESRLNLRFGNDGDARFISACLTDAVIYLHDKMIVHRNVCPHSVYVNQNGDPILGNFEQCTYTTELGVYMHNMCGTIGYQSPEVVAQLGYNHTIDYWGIGCVAYEFLFGIMPYVDADVSRMLSKTVLNPDFAITRLGGRFSRLPKAAQEALRDCFLNRYPHKRIGFKQNDARQIRWFQPFRWDMIRNKEYDSPLKKFLDNNETNSEIKSNQKMEFSYNTNDIPQLKSPRITREKSPCKSVNIDQKGNMPNQTTKELTNVCDGPNFGKSAFSSRNFSNEQQQWIQATRHDMSPSKQQNCESTTVSKSRFSNKVQGNNKGHPKQQDKILSESSEKGREDNQTNILPLINQLFLDKQHEKQQPAIASSALNSTSQFLPADNYRCVKQPPSSGTSELHHHLKQTSAPGRMSVIQPNHLFGNVIQPSQHVYQPSNFQPYNQPMPAPKNVLYSTAVVKTPMAFGNSGCIPRPPHDLLSKLQGCPSSHQEHVTQVAGTQSASGNKDFIQLMSALKCQDQVYQRSTIQGQGPVHHMLPGQGQLHLSKLQGQDPVQSSALHSQGHVQHMSQVLPMEGQGLIHQTQPLLPTPPTQTDGRLLNMFGANREQAHSNQQQNKGDGKNGNTNVENKSLACYSNWFSDSVW